MGTNTLPRVKSVLLIGIAIALTLIGRWVHDRVALGAPEANRELVERLTTLPTSAGDWVMREQTELTKNVINELQCWGYVNRVYENQSSGQQIAVVLLLGPSGPISVHTPDICYSSREWNQLGDRVRHKVSDKNHEQAEFWVSTFESNRNSQYRLRSYYAWGTDGRWQAADSPRFQFAGLPRLFKIQTSIVLPATENADEVDVTVDFLKSFLGSLNGHVFSSPRN